MSPRHPPVVVGVAEKRHAALRRAADAARLRRAPLRIVHAQGLLALATAEFDTRTITAEARRAGEHLLEEVRASLAEEFPDLDLVTTLSDDAPLQALGRESESACLLVVGADDLPWFDRLLRTRIAGPLAMRAACPVLVAPDEDSAPAHGDGHVMVVVDEVTMHGPMRLALDEATHRQLPVRVLHAIAPGTSAEDAVAQAQEMDDVVTGWQTRYPGVQITLEPAQVLDRQSLPDALDRAVLVVVRRPLHDAWLPRFRPLVNEVLRASRCPVAVVAATWDAAW